MNLNNSEEKLSMGSSSEEACTAVSTESGTICGERTSLQILDEFRKLYETRIERVDPNNSNAQELKMKIMEEWIRDLDAQNTMLVKTVQELEEAAYERVKILEDKLKHTSTLLTENMARFEQPTHSRLNELSERIDILKNEDDFLREKIKNLQNDITGLLELLRRAYYEHRWNIDGITFYELTEADIPISFNSDCESANESSNPVGKDLTGMGDDNRVESLTRQSEAFSAATNDNEIEIINLRKELQDKVTEIDRLAKQLDAVEKEALESREALTLEVAEKHDQTMTLKKQVAALEEQCRNANMQLQFRDDVIKEMRNALKQHMKNKTSSPTPATRNSLKHESRELTWGGVLSDESSAQNESESDGTLTDLKNIKTIMKGEQYALVHLKNQLMEVLDTFSVHERKVYEKGLVDAHRKLQDMGTLLENYNTQSIAEDSEISQIFSNTSKLTEAIETLSKISLDKGNEILQLELILHNLREKNDQIQELLENQKKFIDSADNSSNVSRDDFNAMEEFRVCTVEAQAATEDMREEIASVICNLDSRHELFMNLRNAIEQTHGTIVKSENNVSTVIKYLQDQIEEKNVSKEIIMSGESKLKDLKNEINECLAKFKLRYDNNDSSTDQEKLTERQYFTVLDSGNNFLNNLMDKVVEEIEYILCNLRVFISKEDSNCTMLLTLNDQLHQSEENLDELRKHHDRVLQDNDTAKSLYEEKSKKLDKLERELDNAHTRMQDYLESIVLRSQRYDSLNISQKNPSTTQCDDNADCSNIEMKNLKKVVFAKDKLLKHKDEIIRIQKDSIQMTQKELKDLHHRLQKQIDARVDVINEHLEEKKYLLKQSELQNETIKHLQNAVVEAKKNFNRHANNQKDKSTIELAVSDVWTSITPTVFNNGDVQDI